MKNNLKEEVPYFWLSAEEYAEQTGINPKTAKEWCRQGRLEHEMTEGNYFKIKVYKNDGVPREEHERVLKKVVELETIVNSSLNILLRGGGVNVNSNNSNNTMFNKNNNSDSDTIYSNRLNIV